MKTIGTYMQVNLHYLILQTVAFENQKKKNKPHDKTYV